LDKLPTVPAAKGKAREYIEISEDDEDAAAVPPQKVGKMKKVSHYCTSLDQVPTLPTSSRLPL
jgi:hypothetical protein